MYEKLKIFQNSNQDKINIWLNDLVVVYMFFISFIPYSHSVSLIYALIYILILVRGEYLKYLKISLSHPLTIPFLLFMLVHYIWLIGSSDIEKSATIWMCTTYYNFYPLLFFLFVDKKYYFRFIGSFVLGMMISEVLSYLMQFHYIPWEYLINIQLPWKEIGNISNIVFYQAVRGEPTPFFDHSFYGILIAFTASIILIKSIYDENKYTKFLSILFFMTLSINLFFLGGRSGYLLYFVLLFIVVYHALKNLNSKKFVSIIIILTISIVTLMYNTNGLFKKRISETISTISQSSLTDPKDDRVKLALLGLKTANENLIFGLGTGDALAVLRENNEDSTNKIIYVRDVHNQYIDVLLQFGLVGLAVYIYLLYRIFKVKPENEERSIVKSLTLASIITSGFVGTYFYVFPVVFTMFLIVSTANKNIIESNIQKVNIKTILMYILTIILIYSFGQFR